MGGLREVHDQVAGAQFAQLHLRQLGPLLLARTGHVHPGARPGPRGEPGAVVRLRSLRAPQVRFADLLDGVVECLAPVGRRRPKAPAHAPRRGVRHLLCPCLRRDLRLRRGRRLRRRVTERARSDQLLLRLVRVGLLALGDRRDLLGGERGEHLLDIGQLRPDRVALLLLLRGERLLFGEHLPGLGGEGVGAPLAVGEPGDGRQPALLRPVHQMLLIQGVLGIVGEQQLHIGGEFGGALVLLAGQLPDLGPAAHQGLARAGEARSDVLHLGLLGLELDLGGVVVLGRLLGLLVQLSHVGEQCGDAARGAVVRYRCRPGRRGARDRGQDGERRRTDGPQKSG